METNEDNCLHFKNVIITLKSYLKQDYVDPRPHTILSCLKLDFNVKFPLLRLLQFSK